VQSSLFACIDIPAKSAYFTVGANIVRPGYSETHQQANIARPYNIILYNLDLQRLIL